MLRLFRHHIPFPSLALAGFETLLFFVLLYVLYAARTLLWEGAFTVEHVEPLMLGAMSLLSFLVMASVGMYNRDVFFNMQTMIGRGLITYPIIFIVNSMVLFFLSLFWWSEASQYHALVLAAVIIAFPLNILFRLIFVEAVNLDVFRRRILVLGTGHLAANIDKLVSKQAKRHFSVDAYVEFGAPDEADAELSRVLPNSLLEERGALAKYVLKHGIDEIVVASRQRRRREGALGSGLPIWDLMDCKLYGTEVTEYATFWEREAAEIDLDELVPSWLIFSDGFRLDWARQFIKRSFDVLVSLIFLVFTLPITMSTALLVKVTSPGPVFYRQERVGLNGKSYWVLKFRSMRNDAEKDGPQWAKAGDARVTSIGGFMRKTRIDELPQIINVLKGDMSFIGPRPERPVFVAELAKELPFYNERHRVKPGISGWAQINYPYGASIEDAKRKLAYDLYYVKNGSLFLDFVILVQTVRVVLWPEGVR
ncbi:MAG: TIGR03013 family PEP-CTERM/XrtA system glycosyltransferase [Rhodobacterales bacterium]|nr:TIGR03013 family PEP-CTERM/XrtA system glycosyltransferase [Rhodobacterales bacterium]